MPPLMPGALKGPAMAQSWGRSTLVQLPSLKDACTYWTLAPGGVPDGTLCLAPLTMKSLARGSIQALSVL